MRVVKIIAWIFSIYIIQTVFGEFINIMGTVPDLLLAFILIFAFHEWNYKTVAYVTLSCAVLAGSSVGQQFSLDVLAMSAAAVLVHGMSERARFIPKPVRVECALAVSAAVISAAGYFIIYKSMGLAVIMGSILPHTAYTVVCGCIMYPIVVKTLFPKQNKKVFII